MRSADSLLPGTVVFVGAGPGAADLLTIRGLDMLRAAEVVVHDKLVPQPILDLVPATAERFCIDRSERGDPDPGETTGRLLVRLAAAGRRVVRLKGGDPTVFARLAEELAPLRQAGVAYELVPGVTAALAAAAALGIPLTSREAASSLTLVTGHEARGKSQPVDLGSLATLPGTLAVYMGVEQLAAWSQAMMAAGRPADTPVAVVSRCAWPNQRLSASTLGECVTAAHREGWQSPAVLIVGQVAAAAAPRGPLAGCRVIVTRPAGQEVELVAAVRAVGGDPLHLPVIRIVPPSSWAPLDGAIGKLDTYDWIVLASANGVRGFLERLRAAGRDGRCLGTARLAAIGPATRRALEAAGFVCDLVPESYRSEGLVEAFAGLPAGGRFLLVRAASGRELLARELRSGGHAVDEVTAYAVEPIERLDAAGSESLPPVSEEGDVWITITSGAIAEAAVRLFGSRLRRWRIASLSPVTTAALRLWGLEPAVEADVATMEGLVSAIGRRQAASGGASESARSSEGAQAS